MLPVRVVMQRIFILFYFVYLSIFFFFYQYGNNLVFLSSCSEYTRGRSSYRCRNFSPISMRLNPIITGQNCSLMSFPSTEPLRVPSPDLVFDCPRETAGRVRHLARRRLRGLRRRHAGCSDGVVRPLDSQGHHGTHPGRPGCSGRAGYSRCPRRPRSPALPRRLRRSGCP